MHSGVSALAVIVFSIVTTIGCIPVANITYDDDPDVLLEDIDIVPGKTERGDVHKILGNPTISNEEWGIEVYVRAAKWIEFTAPIPLFGIEKAIVPLIILYDADGTVRTTDGVGEGYLYYTYKRVLLAPKSEFKTPSHLSPNECTLYLLPSSSEAIKINGNYLTKGVMNYPYRGTRNQAFEGPPKGYYRLLLSLGKHNITFFDNLRWGGMFSKITIDCMGSRIFYVHNKFKYKFKKSEFEAILYDSPPDEMHKRRLIIYPAVPELIHQLDDYLSNYKEIPFKLDEVMPESMKFDYAREMEQKGIPYPPWSLYAGGRRDHEAVVWLCRSAELGYTYAQMELGRIFWGSNDIKDHRSKSYMWYWLAAESEVDNKHYWDTRIQERAAIEVQYKEDKILTEEQNRLAMQLLLLLEPGQCERDLTEASHKESD